MQMLSTRGAAAVSPSAAILRGLAPDGGLYVPAEFPSFSLAEIAALGKMSYEQRALTVLERFLPDFTREELTGAIRGAYGTGFDCGEIAPIRKVGGWAHALELWHGPTLAFKDMALQLLPHLLTLSAGKNGEQREIFILVTTGGRNTHVIAVNGNFDDAQTGVKRIFADRQFAETMNQQGRVLSSANSINFGRLVPQVVYYFSAYADLLNEGAIKLGDEVNFCVPTGNFGDILAADYAHKAGLPVGRLICASNENNVLTDFINTGVYDIENRPFYKTITPSMDILVSSNLERLLFDLSGYDGEKIARLMGDLNGKKRYEIDDAMKAGMQARYWAGCVAKDGVRAEIAKTWAEDHYLMDPHTAVASAVLRAYQRETGDTRRSVIVSTASPYKFGASVLGAVAGQDACKGQDDFACCRELAEKTGTKEPEQIRVLPTLPIRHTAVCEKDGMEQALLDAVKA